MGVIHVCNTLRTAEKEEFYLRPKQSSTIEEIPDFELNELLNKLGFCL